ncbi:glycosyltransferase family 8 protein [Metabacillus dongyingensis]|uniref:glycosyltransferase family 8 protein n=1 Tax=Metabacillus dongyingensis TaxID=2874282 RepID=UPI001CBB5B35|nr:glycosyltransferase family 8 protein [Metabacillus dongyingensis]UAL50264.1 glycosyltransferase family 8 protein [Metabacillus dongyingensis]
MNLNVVYSSDNNYAQHVGVSMLSLFENNRDFNNINIYLIDNNILLDNKKKLMEICENYKRNIIFIDFNNVSKKLNLDIGNSISINSYARLFIPSLINFNIDKILYLDCDSIVNTCLKQLWNIDINDYYVAGVCDTVSNSTKTRINLEINKPYINAGMLLINLKKWKEDFVERKFIDFIASYNGQVFHHDQGTINGVLNENILILHPKYNAMTTFFTMARNEIMQFYGLKEYYSESELNEAKENPVFVHYTPAFVNRPWIKGCKHPLVFKYKKYLDMTPWRGSSNIKDNRSIIDKIIAFIYNNLPFKMANGICNLILK